LIVHETGENRWGGRCVRGKEEPQGIGSWGRYRSTNWVRACNIDKCFVDKCQSAGKTLRASIDARQGKTKVRGRQSPAKGFQYTPPK